MRILYVCSDLGVPVLGRKGASVHVRALVTALRRAGHAVTLAAASLRRAPWEEPARLDEPIVHVPPSERTTGAFLSLKELNERLGVENGVPSAVRRLLYNDELADELARRFRAEPPDIVYERASPYGIAGATLAKELDVPLLVELNAPLVLEQETYRGSGFPELAEKAERRTLASAAAVLPVSRPLARYVESLGVSRDRIHVLPNAVDPELFAPAPRDPATRERLGLDGGPVVGFVGGMRPWHGLQALPDLLQRLVARHPELRLVIAGDGPGAAALERELRARGLDRYGVFTHSLPHERIAEVVRQFDVALAPYERTEHDFYFSPLKVFEYMACGVPVVAARLGQLEDVVRDGETGLLYAPGDVDGLAAACERLLTDAELRRRIASAAAQEVRDRHTWERNAARVVEIARAAAA